MPLQIGVLVLLDPFDGARVDDGAAMDLSEQLRIQRLLKLTQRRARQQSVDIEVLHARVVPLGAQHAHLFHLDQAQVLADQGLQKRGADEADPGWRCEMRACTRCTVAARRRASMPLLALALICSSGQAS